MVTRFLVNDNIPAEVNRLQQELLKHTELIQKLEKEIEQLNIIKHELE